MLPYAFLDSALCSDVKHSHTLLQNLLYLTLATFTYLIFLLKNCQLLTILKENVKYSLKKAEFLWNFLNYFTLFFTWRCFRVKYKGEFTWCFIRVKYCKHLLDAKNSSSIVWRKQNFWIILRKLLLDLLFRSSIV